MVETTIGIVGIVGFIAVIVIATILVKKEKNRHNKVMVELDKKEKAEREKTKKMKEADKKWQTENKTKIKEPNLTDEEIVVLNKFIELHETGQIPWKFESYGYQGSFFHNDNHIIASLIRRDNTLTITDVKIGIEMFSRSRFELAAYLLKEVTEKDNHIEEDRIKKEKAIKEFTNA